MLLMKRKYSIILVCLVTVAAAAVATLVQASFFDQLSEKYRGTNSQSQQANIIVEEIKRSQANTTGEVTRRWNQIYTSLYRTYLRLKELGYTYNNGQVIAPSVINKKPRKEVYYG